ncbi:serine hydrolase [uncultured Rubinisphaera sp.]|uniref:serine hydrolase domain-containing protein n=1 Tax=uncultured Rubinisphaera sp. TaxID=1678686 RepID=UPI0030DB1E74
MFNRSLSIFVLLISYSVVLYAEPPKISSQSAGMDSQRLDAIEPIVDRAVADQEMPGCVVLIGRRAGIVYHRAFGYRQLLPEKQPMLKETLFDLASLTKPLATATSIHLLQKKGQLQFDDPASQYLPDFHSQGKANITIRQLLTHTSGLLPDNNLKDYQDGKRIAYQRIDELDLRAKPNEKFMYSDVGYIVLGRIVEQVSGSSLAEFTSKEIFQPLQMNETGFNPSETLRHKAAVTQMRDGKWIQGQVHDPRAWELEGIAGHAGLFSTATDLAKYATAILQASQKISTTPFNQSLVNMMSTPQQIPGGLRTLGWDSQSAYSSNRGDLFSSHAFGHGGFTGTSFWIDPELDLYVIFLSNRVHPDGKGSVNRLAGRIGTIAAAAIYTCPDQ